jgi:hypothetical protein
MKVTIELTLDVRTADDARVFYAQLISKIVRAIDHAARQQSEKAGA